MKRAGLVIFLIFILVGWVFVPSAKAQAFNPMPSADEFGATVDQKTNAGQMSKEVYTVNTQVDYMNTGTCMIIGCSNNPNSGFYYGKSAVASIGNVITAMYANPPADLALWIQNTGQTLGFVPRQVNAQGIGFSGLSPLLPIWEAFRNIAYTLLAVIMIVIGFMVMFRKKIDPKTVVTVQNALPKIVLTLLLITFSYAIVGLAIDLMYLSIALIASLLIPVSHGTLGTNTASTYMNGGIGALFGQVWKGGQNAAQDIVNFLSPPTLSANYFGGIMKPIWRDILGGLMWFLVALFVLITFIRIVFLLIFAYIQIIISLLLGPLQILTESLPGSNGFSSWLKNLFANLAVFTITAGVMMFAIIIDSFGTANGNLWTPPLLSGSGSSSGFLGLITIGLLSQIPNFAKAVKEAIKAKPLAGGVSGFGAVGGIATQGVSMGMSVMGMRQAQSSSKALGDSIKAGQEGTAKALQNLANSQNQTHGPVAS